MKCDVCRLPMSEQMVTYTIQNDMSFCSGVGQAAQKGSQRGRR